MVLQRKRLRELAAHLQTVKPEHFNMRFWWKGKRFDRVACGTRGCAMGHACTIPRFRKLGLRLDHDKRKTIGWPMYREYYGLSSAGRFFGLTYAQSTYIFGSDNSGDAKDAANRILAVLNDGEVA